MRLLTRLTVIDYNTANLHKNPEGMCTGAHDVIIFIAQYSATGGQRVIPTSLATIMETKNPKASVREQ